LKRSNMSVPKCILAAMVGHGWPMFSPNLVQCDPLPSEKQSLEIRAENARRKLAESSITQPCIARLCLNFIRVNAYPGRRVVKNFRLGSCCGRHPNWTYLNRNNSASNCSISLKFGIQFEHATADTRQTFIVKGSKFKVTA